MNTIRRIVEFAKVKTFAFKCIAIGAALALVASACVIQLASTPVSYTHLTLPTKA